MEFTYFPHQASESGKIIIDIYVLGSIIKIKEAASCSASVRKVGEFMTHRDKIAKIANALGVEPAYLMGWEDNLNKNSADLVVDILSDSNLVEHIEKLRKLNKEHQEEVEKLKEAGAKVVSLGKRILRTETAAITAVSMCMLYLEMNGETE